MDDWETFLEGRNLPYRPLEGTTNGRVISSSNKKPPKKYALNGRATSELEDQIEVVRDQLLDRLKISQNNPSACANMEASAYENYNFERRFTNSHNLPIYKKKDVILAKIKEHPTVVIEGSTGCGKSTQVCTRVHYRRPTINLVPENTYVPLEGQMHAPRYTISAIVHSLNNSHLKYRFRK